MTNLTNRQDKSDHPLVFSDRVKALQKKTGLSLRKLAAASDLSWQTFHSVYTSKIPASPKTLDKLAAVELRADLTAHLKKGVKSDLREKLTGAESRQYGLPSDASPRPMPTRSDCEQYLSRILDLAAAEGSPENIPAIYHRLTDQFRPNEWKKES